MATQQLQLVCDSSTLANFKSWAQSISTWFSTSGWVQTSDTGQVNWGTISSVPGSGAFVYEIWKPGDSATVFYVKIEYGNVSGTNCPSLRVSIGTGTNGAGTLTGYFTPATNVNASSFTAPSSVTQYECDFCGTSSKIAVMMWRNAPANQGQELFAIQRSLNASGAETSSYATLWTCGLGGLVATQQSIVFGVGVPPPLAVANASGSGSGLSSVNRACTARSLTAAGFVAMAFNGTIPVDCCAPCVGYWDNECTVVGASDELSITEGVTFQVTLYGATKTYMPSKTGPFASFQTASAAESVLVMEYD